MRLVIGMLGCVLSSMAVGADINANIEQLCSSQHMLIKHSVSIGQANGVANSRAQHYQIQPSLTEPQKSQLVTSGIDLGDDCLEYLSKQDVLEVDSDGVVARVYFNFDKSELTQTSKLTLQTLAQRMSSLHSVPNLDVVGHTDALGGKDYNHHLGQHRAQASKVYLVEAGVAKEVLAPHSRGLEQPLQDNSTAQGRAANRRVEIKLADPT
ncbi:OmpA family protein [Vibrio gallicus]|uniref:OmpA family protein n=1 Tax=Vibrio gallicus TaxID=190897 RepID=UPI0021C2F0AA|nr:OmpA family protein [Vibrio gallicus]